MLHDDDEEEEEKRIYIYIKNDYIKIIEKKRNDDENENETNQENYFVKKMTKEKNWKDECESRFKQFRW